MLIWSGHGILIPILAIGGVILGIVLGEKFHLSDTWSMTIGVWAATIFVWMYAVTIGKTQVQTLLDPRSGQQVVIRRRHSLFFIPAIGWVLLLFLLAIGITGLTVTTGGEVASGERGSATDSNGKRAFDAANRLIATADEGVAHGNTAEAKKLAEFFSERLKSLREMGIEQGKKKPVVSLSNGEFLTYCLLTKESCVFLVHVPTLRKFSDDAKDFICAAAWRSAQEVVQSQGTTPKSLGVGVRGALLYERAMAGKVTPLTEDPRAGIDEEVGGSDETDLLARLFELAEKPAEGEVASMVGDGNGAAPSNSAFGDSAAVPSPVNLLPSASVTVLPTGLRDWKSMDGRVMNAQLMKFVDAEGKTAEFKRADGQVFQVPVERFDTAVQQELTQLHQAAVK